jgi:hypothetical protein
VFDLMHRGTSLLSFLGYFLFPVVRAMVAVANSEKQRQNLIKIRDEAHAPDGLDLPLQLPFVFEIRNRQCLWGVTTLTECSTSS